MKVAVITPYYKESDAVLRRCIDSVSSQTHADVKHYFVADGFPRRDITAGVENLLPIDLPSPHRDYGCTPRGVGAMCALNEGADVVCFLDADNLFLPDHVESLVHVYQLASEQGQVLDGAFSSRHIFFQGHEDVRLVVEEDLDRKHVDTSCYSFSRSAAFMWTLWGMIPPAWTPLCDRIIYEFGRLHSLKVAWTGQHTVLYESNWSSHYRAAGLPVPTEGLHDATLQNLSRPSPEEVYARLRMRMPE